MSEVDLEIVHERCCGLDVHKKTIEACALTLSRRERRSFGTMTSDLEQLVIWLQRLDIPIVAMESTGVYWKPVFNILELHNITPIVLNAQHIKAVPGRKTDANDAEWIAKLLRMGLVQGSYIPPREQRELRELVRYRTSLVQERGREVQRLQKTLEGANIKLSSVASNIAGPSARNMIEALIGEATDLQAVANLAKNRLRNKRPELEQSLHGLMGPHQRMLLAMQLRHIDFLDEEIARIDAEIADRKQDDPSFREALELLDTIPGVGTRVAEVVLAEVGTDVNRFPTAAHLAAWSGLAPGNNESAGKRKPGKTRNGNAHLRAALIQAAHASVRCRDTCLSAQYHRIAVRRGGKRAVVAVAHSILIIAYHIIKFRRPYHETGDVFSDEKRRQAQIRHHINALRRIGVKADEITTKTA